MSILFKRKIRWFVIFVFLFLCCGCNQDQVENSFKEKYEQYNEEYLKLEIDEDTIMKSSTLEEIHAILADGTGVIYFGSPTDNLSRRVVEVLLKAADSTGLDVIYEIDHLDGVQGLDAIVDQSIPMVVFVLDGKIVQYHVGTFDRKVELTEEERLQLYQIYVDGIHEVLQDACDERC